MYKTQNNYAFIDSQNLNLGIQNIGWKLDYRKFRIYLKEKYSVEKAYMFIGFVPTNQKLYDSLQVAGFVLHFKPTMKDSFGVVKGNVDADLVLRAVVTSDEYDKAVIVTSDGDFYSLVQHLREQDKLTIVLSPDVNKTAKFLRETAHDKIHFMNTLQNLLAYNRKTPHEDGTS